jgi:hypothetical protein
MTDPRWHLAQLNVGRLLAPVDAPEIAAFVAALEPINAIADADAGLVWRLQTESGNAMDIRPTDDDLFLVNMSVWTSLRPASRWSVRSSATPRTSRPDALAGA